MLKLTASLLAVTLLGCASTDSLRPPANAGGPVGQEYHQVGRYWYFVENLHRKAGTQETSLRLWVALPPDRPGQVVKLGEMVPRPTEILVDQATGTRVAYWRVDNPPVDGTPLVFHYDVDVTNRALSYSIDPALVRRASPDSPEARRFLRSEPWLEQTPELVAKAKEIAGSEPNPYLQAQRVFDWVVEHITYDYPAIAQRGAQKSFARLRGDCGEFSHIFIAMVRSLGVPARSVVANWYDGSGHAWAEIFLPPYGWVPVDTSIAQAAKNNLKGQMPEAQARALLQSRGQTSRDPRSLFGGLYPKRLEVFVGDNVELGGHTPGAGRTFQFLQPGGSTGWPPGFQLTGLESAAVHGGFFLFGEHAKDEKFARDLANEELAAAYLSAHLYERAAQGLRRAIERKPGSAVLHLQLGQALFSMDKLEEAAIEFHAVLRGKAGSLKRTVDTWAHIFLGMTYDLAGRRSDAVESYKRALAVGADHGGSLQTAKHLLKTPYTKPASRDSTPP